MLQHRHRSSTTLDDEVVASGVEDGVDKTVSKLGYRGECLSLAVGGDAVLFPLWGITLLRLWCRQTKDHNLAESGIRTHSKVAVSVTAAPLGFHKGYCFMDCLLFFIVRRGNVQGHTLFD